MSTLKQNRSNRTITPHLLPNSPGQMVFKTIHHLPHRYKGPSPIQRSDIFKNSPNELVPDDMGETSDDTKRLELRPKKRRSKLVHYA
ncbi:17859_t:CDS:2 [Rhizophagus irregularis]|nr:17859_t:CDS:2 [Rhizophagus irregularis]